MSGIHRSTDRRFEGSSSVQNPVLKQGMLQSGRRSVGFPGAEERGCAGMEAIRAQHARFLRKEQFSDFHNDRFGSHRASCTIICLRFSDISRHLPSQRSIIVAVTLWTSLRRDRAMGQLNVLVRKSLSGLMLTVLDEQGERKESNVYVLLDGGKYELNEHHEIGIPYLPPGSSRQTFKALVCEEIEADWVYTEKCDLSIPAESFALELKGDVDNEALVRGNENCQVLLRVSAMFNIGSEVSVKPVLKDDAEGLVVPLRISKPIQSVKASMTVSIVTNNGVKKQLSASLNLYSTEYNPKRNLNIEEIKQSLLTLCSEREPRREWSSLCMRPVLQANRIPVCL